MTYHFIAVASYYSGGKRIGWHYASNEPLDKDVIRNFLDRSQEVLGKLDFGIHRLTTESLSWDSVVSKDSFFEDILIIKDIDAFLKLLISDKELTAMDIAKFFLSVGSVSHLKLQKLIYFAYATYLMQTGERLFKDPIVAYKYGPVVEEVYSSYKIYGRDKIKSDEEEKFRLKEISAPIALAKLYLSNQSIEVVESLITTLQKYWDKSASELVEISHTEGGPWDSVYREGMNCEITDTVISQYHEKEIKRV